jgi:hypothetical protein
MHMLKKPECIHEDENLILERLPKRICGPLQGKVKELPGGWGLQFQEGLNTMLLTSIVLLVSVGILFLAILFSVLENDLQGPFAIASYVITAVGVLVILVPYSLI